MSFKALSVFGAAAALLLGSVFLLASGQSQSGSSGASTNARETVAKPLTDKQKKA